LSQLKNQLVGEMVPDKFGWFRFVFSKQNNVSFQIFTGSIGEQGLACWHVRVAALLRRCSSSRARKRGGAFLEETDHPPTTSGRVMTMRYFEALGGNAACAPVPCAVTESCWVDAHRHRDTKYWRLFLKKPKTVQCAIDT